MASKKPAFKPVSVRPFRSYTWLWANPAAYLHSPVSEKTGHEVFKSIDGNSGCGFTDDVKSGVKGGVSSISETFGIRMSCVLAAR